jgi:hypothetical protein
VRDAGDDDVNDGDVEEAEEDVEEREGEASADADGAFKEKDMVEDSDEDTGTEC